MTKILLIGLDYHGYTTAIAQELERSYGKVDFFSIQPRTLFFKSIRRISIGYWQHLLDEYHGNIISSLEVDGYDVVIFIQAHQFSDDNLRKLRAGQRRAKFTLYNWDSLKTHDYASKIPAFDRVFTFDPDDASSLGIGYLPLFCLPEFYEVNISPTKENDVYFVGNIVTMRRFIALDLFGSYCKKNSISFISYQVASPYIYTKVLLSKHSSHQLRLSSISAKDIAILMRKSAAVFDFANHIQSGLTMRTIENLCAGVKIITSNRRVLDEPFYSPDRILVYNDLDFSGVADFLSTPIASPSERFSEYHLPTFVKNLVTAA